MLSLDHLQRFANFHVQSFYIQENASDIFSRTNNKQFDRFSSRIYTAAINHSLLTGILSLLQKKNGLKTSLTVFTIH